MKIGFAVAMESEYEPFLSGLGVCAKTESLLGMEFCTYVSMDGVTILAKCGIGEIAAASATALLISKFDCDYIVNFGLVGSLDGRALRSLVAVKDVVHYDCDLSPFGQPVGQPADMDKVFFPADPTPLKTVLADLPAMRLASGDKFIADTTLKNSLVAKFSANICDMEGAAIAIVCARAAIPFTMIKLISDSADDNAVETFSESKSQAFGSAVDLVLSLIRSRK